jgi:hypothetical protein
VHETLLQHQLSKVRPTFVGTLQRAHKRHMALNVSLEHCHAQYTD